MPDLINHPAHYEEQSIKLEPIDFCERLPFCEGNVLKYCFRAGHKDGASELQDLKKARWYLNRSGSKDSAEVEDTAENRLMFTFLRRDNGILGIVARKYYDSPEPMSFTFWEYLSIHIAKRIQYLENAK